MASKQKISKNTIYYGIGGVILIIIIILFFSNKSDGSHKLSTSRLPINPNIFPVIPPQRLDAFLQYYNSKGFEHDASKILDNYDKFSDSYNESLTEVELDVGKMGNILISFRSLNETKANGSINKNEADKIINILFPTQKDKIDKILGYNFKLI